MKVFEITTRPVPTVRPNARIADAVDLLAQQGLSALPVVDDRQRIVGIFSEADALARELAYGDANGTVDSVMTRAVQVFGVVTRRDVVLRLVRPGVRSTTGYDRALAPGRRCPFDEPEPPDLVVEVRGFDESLGAREYGIVCGIRQNRAAALVEPSPGVPVSAPAGMESWVTVTSTEKLLAACQSGLRMRRHGFVPQNPSRSRP